MIQAIRNLDIPLWILVPGQDAIVNRNPQFSQSGQDALHPVAESLGWSQELANGQGAQKRGQHDRVDSDDQEGARTPGDLQCFGEN